MIPVETAFSTFDGGFCMANLIDVCYDDDSYRQVAPEDFVLSYLGEVLKAVGLEDVEFSVSFVDEDNMHGMNKEYRGIDDSTDILSFAAEDEDPEGIPFVNGDTSERVLGDILICPEVMERNAKTFEVPVQEELRRLLIHGVLHLSGENHATNDASEPMLMKQESILSQLG